MAERNKHLARPRQGLRHILPHDRVAAGKPLFVPQTFENPLRRMTRLLVNAPVVLQDIVDPGHIGPSFFDTGRSRADIPAEPNTGASW